MFAWECALALHQKFIRVLAPKILMQAPPTSYSSGPHPLTCGRGTTEATSLGMHVPTVVYMCQLLSCALGVMEDGRLYLGTCNHYVTNSSSTVASTCIFCAAGNCGRFAFEHFRARMQSSNKRHTSDHTKLQYFSVCLCASVSTFDATIKFTKPVYDVLRS